MTLFEVLIVVAILAMISSGIAVAVMQAGAKAKVTHAGNECRVIRQAAQQWLFSGGSGCPTVTQLIDDELLDHGARELDPWGTQYTITCGDDVVVRSNGRDRERGNADDIVVPGPRRQAP